MFLSILDFKYLLLLFSVSYPGQEIQIFNFTPSKLSECSILFISYCFCVVTPVWLHIFRNHFGVFTAYSAVPLWRVSVFGHCLIGCGCHRCLSPACWAPDPADAETKLNTGPDHAGTGEAPAELSCSQPEPESEGDAGWTTAPEKMSHFLTTECGFKVSCL